MLQVDFLFIWYLYMNLLLLHSKKNPCQQIGLVLLLWQVGLIAGRGISGKELFFYQKII